MQKFITLTISMSKRQFQPQTQPVSSIQNKNTNQNIYTIFIDIG